MSIGTHFIQDIVVSNNVPNQIEISCRFLVDNNVATGFLAIIHSVEDNNNIHYLVVQNNNQDIIKGNVSNLRKDTYTVILYTLNDNGLPSRQAAGFPQDLSINLGM